MTLKRFSCFLSASIGEACCVRSFGFFNAQDECGALGIVAPEGVPSFFLAISCLELEIIMAKPAHIADFERLEEEIDEALIQKSTDDPMIVDLKRRKSHLRNEIELLRHAPTASSEHDELLACRLAMLGLDPYVIECGDRETFDQIKRLCTSCDFREACAVDLKRDPNNPVW